MLRSGGTSFSRLLICIRLLNKLHRFLPSGIKISTGNRGNGSNQY